MKTNNIRVKQLKEIKTRYIAFIYLGFLSLSVLFGFIVFLLLFFYKNNDNFYLLLSLLIFLFVILIIILLDILYNFLNKHYKNYYLEFLFNECKLDEIYYFKKKISKANLNNEKVKKLLLLKSIKYSQMYSDASTKFMLDIYNVSYVQKTQKKKGCLFSVNFDHQNNIFLHLSKEDKIINFENGKLYGFSIKSLLKRYSMITNLDKKAYLLENNIYGAKIISLERFLKSDLNIILDNDTLHIFVKNYTISFCDNLFSRINDTIFLDKIEAMESLHKLLFDVIEMFYDKFVIDNLEDNVFK